MKTGTKIISLLLSLVMLAGLLPAAAFATDFRRFDAAPNETYETAFFGGEDRYAVSLPQSGRLTVRVSTQTLEDVVIRLTNAQKQDLGVFYGYAHEKDAPEDPYVFVNELLGGEYEIRISSLAAEAAYTVEFAFAPVNETVPERFGGALNKQADAPEIPLNGSVTGMLAIEDDTDLYKLVLPEPGRLTVDYSCERGDEFRLETGDGESAGYPEHENAEPADGWNYRSLAAFELTAGTYWIRFAHQFDRYIYTFTTAFTPAGESFPEAIGALFNDPAAAPAAALGETYTGHLALNDGTDYFRFTVETPSLVELTWTGAPRYYTIREAADLDMSFTAWNETTFAREAVAGDYVLEVTGDVGVYTFALNATPTAETFPEAAGALKNNARTAPALPFNEIVEGQIAFNDRVDAFAITLEEEKTFTLEGAYANGGELEIKLYDHSDNLIDWQYHNCDYTLAPGKYTAYIVSGEGAYRFMTYTLGDVDFDGEITAADARLALRIAVDLDAAEADTPRFAAADYNKNGMIRADDARCILRVAVGLEP